MTDQQNYQPNEGPPGGDAEEEAFRRFLLKASDRTAWSSERLLKMADDIGRQVQVKSPAWSRLREELGRYVEWADGRLIALVERLQTGQRPDDAGQGELFHAED